MNRPSACQFTINGAVAPSAIAPSVVRVRHNGPALRCVLLLILGLLGMGLLPSAAKAQTFRFNLRAEPDVIPANGISATSILVQVQNTGGAGIVAEPIVRFATTSGIIEPQTRLTNGIARVLLRSSTTPGTAIVTAFINNAREQVAVEFSNEAIEIGRYLQVDAPYVAYAAAHGIITASGQCLLDYGGTRIESDVRLDVDLVGEKLWAEGGAGQVIIRHGNGKEARELRGDRLFYDLRRRRGVMRRSDTTLGPARQEFMDFDFKPIPDSAPITPSTSPAREPSLQPASSKPATDAPIQPQPAPQKEEKDKPVSDKPGDQPEAKAQSTPVTAEPEEPGIIESGTLGLTNLSARINADAALLPRTALPRTAILPDKANETTPAPENDNQPENDSPDEGQDKTEGQGKEKSEDIKTPPPIPDYRPLEPEQAAVTRTYRLTEPLPREVDNQRGYWIVARRVRVFPRDKVQFARATIFFNGARLFAMPLYVVSLNGSYNPATDMVSLNTHGGLSLNMPYYYQASARGTGTLYLQHAPRHGFSAHKPGFSLALDQQYYLSGRSQGNLKIDEVGRGGWNLNWDHKIQLSPTLASSFYVDMPEHRNLYAHGSILKQLKSMDLGFEGFYT
ncbi:MAG: hypothetical protein M3347_03955, partial [Armatimonadota bacterium]|nr:hypothetical protein [Armatimonadota bacterium]